MTAGCPSCLRVEELEVESKPEAFTLGVEACLGPAATAEPMHVTNPETSGKIFKVNILLALNLIPQI
jgi:hypothetical protein